MRSLNFLETACKIASQGPTTTTKRQEAPPGHELMDMQAGCLGPGECLHSFIHSFRLGARVMCVGILYHVLSGLAYMHAGPGVCAPALCARHFALEGFESPAALAAATTPYRHCGHGPTRTAAELPPAAVHAAGGLGRHAADHRGGVRIQHLHWQATGVRAREWVHPCEVERGGAII